jgi:hypothetical protein
MEINIRQLYQIPIKKTSHPTVGALPFKKNLMKILIEQNISKEAEGPGLDP